MDALVTLDDDSVVTGSGDGVIRVVSILPNKLLGVLGEDPEGGCDRLALSGDKSLLASISYSPVLHVWDLEADDQVSQKNASDPTGFPLVQGVETGSMIIIEQAPDMEGVTA